MDDRAEKSLIQRTRPDPIGPRYAGPPPGRPPAPASVEDEFLAVVVSGVAMGKAKVYPVTGGNQGEGCYVDEANPATLAPFYPSHTRDGTDTWIETVAYNQPRAATANPERWFWPLPVGSLLAARKIAVGASYRWMTWQPPMVCQAIVTGVGADGIPNAAEWRDPFTGLTLSILVPAIWGGPVTIPGWHAWYPQALAGDLISLAPSYHAGVLYWQDLTARVSFDQQALGGPPIERPVYTDPAGLGGRGIAWILDTDT